MQNPIAILSIPDLLGRGRSAATDATVIGDVVGPVVNTAVRLTTDFNAATICTRTY